MKLYIAGPMRGRPCYNFEKFFAMAYFLRRCGFEVFNPAENDTVRMFEGWQYTPSQYPEILLKDMHHIAEDCDGVVVLDEWELSPGARAESAFTQAIGRAVITEKEILHEWNEYPLDGSTAVAKLIVDRIGEKDGR